VVNSAGTGRLKLPFHHPKVIAPPSGDAIPSKWLRLDGPHCILVSSLLDFWENHYNCHQRSFFGPLEELTMLPQTS